MEAYRINEGAALYYLTFSVIDWLPVFICEEPCLIVTDSLNYCHREKCLRELFEKLTQSRKVAEKRGGFGRFITLCVLCASASDESGVFKRSLRPSESEGYDRFAPARNPEALTAADRATIAALGARHAARRDRRLGPDRGGAGGGRDRGRPHLAGPARPDAQPALVPAVGRGRRLADAPPRDRSARLHPHQRIRRPRDPDQRAHPGAAARLRPALAAGHARPTARRTGNARSGRTSSSWPAKRWLLIGVGAIGERTARLAAALDVRVIGVRRDPDPPRRASSG